MGMKRRNFIALLASSATAWPFAARAQQPARLRRIGVLPGGPDTDDSRSQRNVAAFVQTLQQLGWTDSRNVNIDYRWPAGDPDKTRKYAGELVALAPDVILGIGEASLSALLQATRTVPIVLIAVSAPAGAAFVARLTRPGVAATGCILSHHTIAPKRP